VRAGPRPAIRAVQTRALVEMLTELSPSQRATVLERLRPDVLDRARRGFGLAWFPMADHMHFSDVVYEVVGRETFRELFGRAFETSMQTAVLRGIFEMIRRVADDPGATLMRNAPRIYAHVTRDVGELVAKVEGRGHGVVEMHGWPSSQWNYEVWLTGTQACIEGALHSVGLGASARVDVELRDEPNGSCVYRAQW